MASSPSATSEKKIRIVNRFFPPQKEKKMNKLANIFLCCVCVCVAAVVRSKNTRACTRTHTHTKKDFEIQTTRVFLSFYGSFVVTASPSEEKSKFHEKFEMVGV